MKASKKQWVKYVSLLVILIFGFAAVASAAPDVYEPDDDPGSAAIITIGETQDRSLSPAGDVDYLIFTVAATTTVDIETTGSSGDTTLTLYDNTMYEIAYDDDGGSNSFSKITYTVDPGQYFILVEEYWGNELASYSITLSTGVPPGSISGNVTDSSSGLPVQDIWVDAYTSDTWDWAGSTLTDANGDYTISGLQAGDYIVSADTSGTSYLPEFYSNTYDMGSAVPVSVTSGADTPNIDFALETGGSISGTVTDGVGSPIENLQVCSEDFYSQMGAGCTPTQADGTYTLGGLHSSDYRVYVDTWGTNYLGEYYNNIYDWNSANPVSVTQGADTPNIDFALETGGSISGTVTDGVGSPIENLQVCAEDFYSQMSAGCVWTQADGTYLISRLFSSEYRVNAYTGGTQYVEEYYNNVYDWNSANPVSVTQGADTPNIDFALETGGSISGTITDGSSTLPVENLWVCAEDAHTQFIMGCSWTEPDGTYVIMGLLSSDYRVSVDTWGTDYLEEYYNNQYDWNSADLVSVTQGADTPNIDFALETGGSISGTVTDNSTGLPVAGMWVNASDSNWNGYGNAQTDVNGQYSIGGLPSRTDYKVSVQGDATYASQTQEPISVTAPGNTIVDFALEPAGSISGTVTDDFTGLPIAGMWVNVQDSTWNGYGNAQTDVNGQYSISGLPSRTDYIVSVQGDATYASQTQSPVTVAAPGNTVVDFALTYGGSISGTVTDAVSGLGIGGVDVSVHDISSGDWIQLGWTQTDASGAYTIEGVPEGNWMVSTWADNQGYVRQVYDGVINTDDHTPVPVTAGQTTTDINFALIKGGSISGTVTDSIGTPLAGVRVESQLTGNGDTWLGDAQTDGSGNYTLNGLPAGDVLVVVTAPGTNFVGQYYTGALYSADATPVSVVAETTTTGIDFALTQGGMLTGALTADGSPVSEGYMSVYSVDEGRWMFMSVLRGSVIDDQTGTWTMAVPPGTYKILGNAEIGGGYPEKYYGDTYLFANATEVTVTGTETVSGLDIDLTPDAAAIEGTLVYGGSQTGMAIFYLTPTSGGVWPDISGAEGGDIGGYMLSDIPAGTWYVKAFIDVDGDLIFDADEPSGEYAGGAVTVGIGETVSGVDITITDPVQEPVKIGIYQDGYWYLDANNSWQWDGEPTDTLGVFGVGLEGEVPVAGDWNGDGQTEIGVYMDGIWYLDMNGNWQWDGEPTDTMGVFGVGLVGAVPVVGDWNGDNITEIGVYMDGTWYLDANRSWQWDGEPTDIMGVFGVGLVGEEPVVGDWNGDGTSEIGIYQDGYWYLDVNRSWQWDGEPTDTLGVFGVGLTGEVPVAGDWNADGTTEIGIYQDGYWYLDVNRSWQWDGEPTDTLGIFGVGLTGEIPMAGKW